MPMSNTAMPVAPYKYVSLPNAVKSTSKTMKFTPSNGTSFTPLTSNNICRIDIRSNGFLCGNESYLRFNITNGTDQPIVADPMATGVIDRVRILSGSTVLSDIAGYAELANHLVQTAGTDDLLRTLSIVGGLDANNNNYPILGGTTANDYVVQVGSGSLLAGETETFAIPLVTGILSGSRYVPLEFLAGGLTIELYFQTTFYKAFMAASATAPTTPAYTISGVEYVGKVVQIDDDMAMNNLKQLQLTQGLKIKSYDWSLYQNTITAANSNFNIPARNMSLKSLVMLLTHPSPSAVISGIQSYRSNVTAYSVRIGSVQYPIQDIAVDNSAQSKNLCEAFSEVMKCYNSGGLWNVLGSTAIFQPHFNNQATYTKVGSFAMGVSFENYGESDLFSGLDTATLSLPVNFKITMSAAPAVNLNALCYSNFDVVYTILPNGQVQVEF